MNSSWLTSKPIRYGRRKMAATDWLKNRLSSPNISIGARNGFIHAGAAAGWGEVDGSAMRALLLRESLPGELPDGRRTCPLPDSRVAGQATGAQPDPMAGWALLALLAAAGHLERERAGRASALISYVAADYPTAVGPRGEVLSPEELAEQGQFVREAAAVLRSSAAEDLAR